MESRFGNDFADVRVHTGDQAIASARAVGASAYTLGRDVVFGSGRYTPHTRSGRRLIAHELAHVVQQGQPGIPRTGHDDLLEHDANQAASKVMRGIAPIRVERASPWRLSRETGSDEDKYCRLKKSSPGPTRTKVDAAIELFRRAGLYALKHPPENDRAAKLLEAVETYFRGIVTPQNVDRLFTGASKTYLSMLADGGLDAVQSMIRSLRSGSSTMCGLWDRKFDQLQIARQPLLILSGEADAKAASLPGAVNEAFQTSLIIAGTIMAVLISGGVIGAAAEAAGGVIASETAAQLIAGTRVGTLVISNPAVAEQIFLFSAGTVIEIVAAGGIKEYLRQLSTPEGAANKLFEILHLRLTMGGGGSGRNRTVEVPVEEVPTPPTTTPATKIRIRLKEPPSRSTTRPGSQTGSSPGPTDELQGPESSPAPNKKAAVIPKPDEAPKPAPAATQVPKSPPAPPPGMSTGEVAEAAALKPSRPNATLLGEKAGGYDATEGGQKIVNSETNTKDRDGKPIVVRDVTIRGADAIQIKTVTQIDKFGQPSKKPLPDLVADNVRAAMKKAYNQPVTRARARTPLPGTNIYERTHVESPKKITIIVQVPGPVTKEMRDAAANVVATDTMAAELPPIEVVVQTAQ